MNAFAAAVAALVADPNLGVDAIYRAGGTGMATAIRVVRSMPDRLAEAFGTSVLQATDVPLVAVADIASPIADDSFAIGDDSLVVLHAEHDASSAAWRVFCRR